MSIKSEAYALNTSNTVDKLKMHLTTQLHQGLGAFENYSDKKIGQKGSAMT